MLPESDARSGLKGKLLTLLPILSTLSNYTFAKAKSDFRAALNVALLDFPQGMAYAMIAGLPFNRGILASIISSTIGPMAASSRFLMLGPTNAIAVLTLSTFLALGFDQNQGIAVMPLFLLLIAAFMLIGSFLKLANLVNYVSRTVITAYISTAAFLIISKQLAYVLGITLPASSTIVATVFGILRNVSGTQFIELWLSVVTCCIFLGFKRWCPRIPAIATTLAVMYGVGQVLLHQSIPYATLQNGAVLTADVFSFSLPGFSMHEVAILAPGALAVAFLSLLESSSIAKSLAAQSGDVVDCNQQMRSMGFANIGCALLSGMPISGSLTRSMLNFRSGAQTPLASVYSGILLALLYLLLIAHIGHIPQAALASLVIWVGISLLNKHDIRIALTTTPSDRMVFLLTVVCGVFFTLNTAIAVGVVSSMLFFIQRAANPNMVEYQLNTSGKLDGAHKKPGNVALFHVDGDLFFASSDLFLNQVRNLANHPELKVLILRLRNAHNLDATCVIAIQQLLRFMKDTSRHLIISGAHAEVYKILEVSRLLEAIGDSNVIKEDMENPTLSTSLAIKRAVEIVGREATLTLYVSDTDIS
jgi:sulfate permease, SulP family